MPHLILVRHSVSKPVPGQSAHTWELTAEGRARCAALADRLRPYGIAHVASSDEPKAHATAVLLAGHLGLSIPVTLDPDLRETHRESTPYYDDEAEFRAAIHTAMEQPNKLRFGEETFADARVRLAHAVERLVAAHPGQTLAAVTHGTVMAMYLAHVGGGDAFDLWTVQQMSAYAVLDLPGLALTEYVPVVTA